MTPIEIKIELLKHGSSQAKIADNLNVQRQAVNFAVHGTRTNRRIRVAIAEAIRQPLSEVFPDEEYREQYGRIVKPMAAKA